MGKGGAIMTQRICFYFWGFLRLCQFLWKSIKKCDRESAHKRIPYTDTLTDANRFYNLSHAICYSYGTDKKTADWRDCGNGVKDVEFNPASAARWPSVVLCRRHDGTQLHSSDETCIRAELGWLMWRQICGAWNAAGFSTQLLLLLQYCCWYDDDVAFSLILSAAASWYYTGISISI